MGICYFYEMENIYQPPVAPSADHWPDSRKSGRALAILGLVLFYGPFFSIMLVLFIVFASVKEAVSTARLEVQLEQSFWILVLGFFVGFIGLFLLLVALLKRHNREPWFFWCSVSASGLWCIFLVPLGTLVGGIVLTIFMLRRREFLDASVKMQGGLELLTVEDLPEQEP